MKNYYEELGVSKKATASEIKNAYKKMAKQYHPDLGGDEIKFKQINEAYQILNDPNKKAEYDIKLNSPRRGRSYFSFDDFFRARGFSNDNDFYEDPFVKSHYGEPYSHQYNHNKPKRKTKGSDLKISIDIFPEDTLREFAKKFTYNRNILCASCKGEGHSYNMCVSCNGTGHFKMTEDHYVRCSTCEGSGKIYLSCSSCKGEGFQKEKKEVKINIPKGITYSSTTKMKGFGNQGTNNEFGDLIIHVRDVVSSENFKVSEGIKDKYVYSEEIIDFFDAIIGGEFECSTLRGTADVKLEPMQLFKNHKIRIPNAGIPKQFGMQEYTPHIVFFMIQYPDISEEHITYIQKIKEKINGSKTNINENKRSRDSEIENIRNDDQGSTED